MFVYDYYWVMLYFFLYTDVVLLVLLCYFGYFSDYLCTHVTCLVCVIVSSELVVLHIYVLIFFLNWVYIRYIFNDMVVHFCTLH